MATIGSLVANLELQSAAFNRGLDRAAAALRSQTAQMRRQNQLLQRSFDDVRRSVDVVRAGFAALGAGLVIRNIVDATTALERINNTLRAGTGSAQAAAQAYEFVRAEAQRLGLDLRTAADQFGSLSAAARGTALEGQAARDIFVAVASAMTALGRSSEQTSGAITAIEQIISKGTVSAEELRGQLGERLPGAFQIAARSIGVTTQALGDMLKAGELTAEEFLPKFAAELQKAFGAEAQQAAQGLQASLNRLNTSVFEFTTQVGQGGVAQAITDFAAGLSEASKGSENLARSLGAGLGTAIRALGEAVLFVSRHFREFAAAFAAFVALRAAAIIGAVATAAFQAANALRLMAIGMLAVNTAMGKNVVIKLAQALVAAGAAIGTYLALTDDTAAETEALNNQLADLEQQLGPGGTTGVSGAASDAAEALAKLREQTERENQQLKALVAAHNGYGSTVNRVNRAIEIDNRLRAAKITRQEAERSGLLKLMVANQHMREEVERLTEAEERRLDQLGEMAKAEGDLRLLQQKSLSRQDLGVAAAGPAATESAEAITNAFETAQENIQSGFADTFTELFRSGELSFKSLADSAVDIFARLAGEIAALMVIRPVLAGAAGVGGVGGLQSLFGTAAGGAGGFLGAPSGATFGGLALSGGLGALGGSLIGGQFGGHGNIGGGVGGGIGALAGTALFGPLGGVIGGIGGSLIGGLIGSLFGGGSSGNQVSLSGGFGRAGAGGTSEASAFVRSLDQQILDLLTERQTRVADRLLRDARGVTVQFGDEGPSANDLSRLAASRIAPTARGLGFRASAIAGRGRTPEQQLGLLNEAIQLERAIEDLTGAVTPFQRALRDLRTNFAEAEARAKEFGISTRGMAKALREAEEELRAQRQFERQQFRLQLQTIIGAGDAGNELRFVLLGIELQFEELKDRAKELGISLDLLNEAETAARNQARAAARDAAQAAALSVVQPFQNLLGPLESFTRDLESTLLNPAALRARAEQDFEAIAKRALAGDLAAIEQLDEAGRFFIEQAGRFGASPGQVDATQRVLDITSQVTDRVEKAQKDASRGIEDAIGRASRAEVDTLKEVVAEVREVAGEIKKLERQLAQASKR